MVFIQQVAENRKSNTSNHSECQDKSATPTSMDWAQFFITLCHYPLKFCLFKSQFLSEPPPDPITMIFTIHHYRSIILLRVELNHQNLLARFLLEKKKEPFFSAITIHPRPVSRL
jgi:hypothetical protein